MSVDGVGVRAGNFREPGIGGGGDAFAAALGIPAYAVDYPASMAFNDSVLAGVGDVVRHIAACPGTRFVLAGHSQGAAVASFVTSDVVPDGIDTDLRPLSPAEAGRIKAVILFAAPSPGFSALLGVPQAAIGGRFQGKTLEICADGDPICGNGSDFSIHSSYAFNGSVQDAVNYVRSRL